MRKLLILSLLALSACSSAPKTGVENAGSETVLTRIDGRSDRPDWLQESEPFKIEGGKVYSLGQTTIPGESRVEAAYRIAENNGKGAIAGAIEQRLDFVFQNAEEGVSIDSTQARYIGAEASKLTASSIRLAKRYWEKYSVVGSNGMPEIRYRVFTLVTMPEQDFKAAIVDAARRAQGKGGLSADFAKQVSKHWDNFVNNENLHQVQEDRQIAKDLGER